MGLKSPWEFFCGGLVRGGSVANIMGYYTL